MSSHEKKIRGFIETKIALYHELKEVLEKERASIMASNVDQLWGLSAQKQRIVAQIEQLRCDMIECVKEEGLSCDLTVANFQLTDVIQLLPKKSVLQLNKHLAVIDRLKREIQSLASDNRQFVEEYLATLNDLVNIFTDSHQSASTYTNAAYAPQARQSNVLLHREV
jgi:flagellar biosynthesis/type III secretory pathway chaperone